MCELLVCFVFDSKLKSEFWGFVGRYVWVYLHNMSVVVFPLHIIHSLKITLS